MNIYITESAETELLSRRPELTSNLLLIKFDIDGCGCVVSGVSKLIEVKEISEGEELLLCNSKCLKVAVQTQYKWAYDNTIIIEYSTTAKMFQLKSPNEMLNPRMMFVPLV
ncbi:iron-sulfur cluster biosynthesis family protein [Bacillus shivajii]|uniref:iron-sulfur cluster biosynthesis family protein n=1 Tax=Bacillus shivajii TaxID=1983719 RepID=UPI001CFBF165|nr:iron-sulfur cluster biosynthesis family protein [Bacillus shivajii]UCZ54541.1 iron-sulfur cluster biosynthesis family protein [Bacillus shivajii]